MSKKAPRYTHLPTSKDSFNMTTAKMLHPKAVSFYVEANGAIIAVYRDKTFVAYTGDY